MVLQLVVVHHGEVVFIHDEYCCDYVTENKINFRYLHLNIKVISRR